jgi:hypothetical protein
MATCLRLGFEQNDVAMRVEAVRRGEAGKSRHRRWRPSPAPQSAAASTIASHRVISTPARAPTVAEAATKEI